MRSQFLSSGHSKGTRLFQGHSPQGFRSHAQSEFSTLGPAEPHGHACGSHKELLKEQAQYFRVAILLTNSSCTLVRVYTVVSLLPSTE